MRASRNARPPAAMDEDPPMKATCTPELEAYLARRGYTLLEVSIVDARTCCAGYSEVLVTPLRGEAAAQARQNALRVMDAGACEVAVVSRGVEIDDEVRFELVSFLGAKDVRANGMRAFSLR